MSRFTVDIYNVDIDKLVYVDILWKILFREGISRREYITAEYSFKTQQWKRRKNTLQAPACLSWSLS